MKDIVLKNLDQSNLVMDMGRANSAVKSYLMAGAPGCQFPVRFGSKDPDLQKHIPSAKFVVTETFDNITVEKMDEPVQA